MTALPANQTMCTRLPRTPALLAISALAIVTVGLAQAGDFPHAAQVVAKETLSHDVVRVTLRLEDPGRFRLAPAQYVRIRVPAPFVEAWNRRYGTSHQEVARPYSIASAPHRLPEVELIVRRASPPPGKDVPPGLASTWIHDTLAPGDQVRLSDPAGALWSESDTTGPLLLIAGGAGVSPLAGLLEHLFEQRLHEKRPVYLFFGARERRDLLLDARFRDWARAHPNFHYVPVLSNPAPGDNWQGETGFANEAVARRFPQLPDGTAAIAGSPAMIRATLQTLTSIGVPKERIRHDPIPAP